MNQIKNGYDERAPTLTEIKSQLGLNVATKSCSKDLIEKSLLKLRALFSKLEKLQ